MKEILLDIDELVECFINQDSQSQKITKQDKETVVQKVMVEARALAKGQLAEGILSESLCTFISKHVRIVEVEQGNTNAYSEFAYPSNVIRLYRENILIAKQTMEAEYGPISEDRFDHLFLLHEYFHYLEMNVCGNFSKKYKIRKDGMFPHWINLRCLSEIGAHTFVRTLILDPLHYIKGGKVMTNNTYLIDVNNKESFRIMNQTGVKQCIIPSPTLHNASWDGILSEDGTLYLSLCSELTTSEYAKLAVYDSETNQINELFYSKDYIFSNDRFIRDSKFHTSFAWLNDGRLLMMSHTTDKAPEHPAWMPLPYYNHPWEGFVGSSILLYNPKTNQVENFGIPVHRETLYGGAYDAIHNVYYTIGFLKGHLYAIDLNDRSVKDYGQVAERASYRLIVGSDHNIYFTTRNGILQRVNVATKQVENLKFQLPYSEELQRQRPYLTYGVNGSDGKLYMTGMYDDRLSCYDPKTNEFSLIGRFMHPTYYAKGIEVKHYLGCMAFDKMDVLYYAVCASRVDREEDYKVASMLMRWDFKNNHEPECLGLIGTLERVVTTTCSMLIDKEKDTLYVIGTNHANDGSDVTIVDLAKYRGQANNLGEATKDPFVYPGNNLYVEHAESIHNFNQISAENPYLFTAKNVIPVPLWPTFEDEEIENSSVQSLTWVDGTIVAICGKDKFYQFIIDANGTIISKKEVEKPKTMVSHEFDVSKLPYYPGRQYKREVTHAVELTGNRKLAATTDGMLFVEKDNDVYALGPAWVNGGVQDMVANKDKSLVYGVAGDRDDINIVFKYSDKEGLRWLGSVAFDGYQYGNHSSPCLSSIALSTDDSILAIGASERLGCVYLYEMESSNEN